MIKVTLEKKGKNKLKIKVIDNGIGIDNKKLKEIFKPYSQYEVSQNKRPLYDVELLMLNLILFLSYWRKIRCTWFGLNHVNFSEDDHLLSLQLCPTRISMLMHAFNKFCELCVRLCLQKVS